MVYFYIVVFLTFNLTRFNFKISINMSIIQLMTSVCCSLTVATFYPFHHLLPVNTKLLTLGPFGQLPLPHVHYSNN